MVRRGREAFREALRRHRVDAYAQHLGAPPPSAASSAYPAPVAQAVDYLLNHLGDPLTQAAMARRVGYSKNHFCRVFKQHTGESYNAFLSRARIERACVLMRDWRVDAKGGCPAGGVSGCPLLPPGVPPANGDVHSRMAGKGGGKTVKYRSRMIACMLLCAAAPVGFLLADLSRRLAVG